MISQDVKINLVTEEKLDHQENREEHNYKGKFFNKNGMIYIKYQEQVCPESAVTTILKISDSEMYVTRGSCEKKETPGSQTCGDKNQTSGSQASGDKNQMHFVANESTSSVYNTPYGDYIMELKTSRYTPVLMEDSMEVVLEYQVLLNGADAGFRKLHFMIRGE